MQGTRESQPSFFKHANGTVNTPRVCAVTVLVIGIIAVVAGTLALWGPRSAFGGMARFFGKNISIAILTIGGTGTLVAMPVLFHGKRSDNRNPRPKRILKLEQQQDSPLFFPTLKLCMHAGKFIGSKLNVGTFTRLPAGDEYVYLRRNGGYFKHYQVFIRKFLNENGQEALQITAAFIDFSPQGEEMFDKVKPKDEDVFAQWKRNYKIDEQMEVNWNTLKESISSTQDQAILEEFERRKKEVFGETRDYTFKTQSEKDQFEKDKAPIFTLLGQVVASDC